MHCCAPGPPLDLFRQAGAAGVSVDLSFVDTAALDALGELVEVGLTLFAGAVPSTGERPPSSASVARDVTDLWDKLGFARAELAERVVVTPTCGLAGATSRTRGRR